MGRNSIIAAVLMLIAGQTWSCTDEKPASSRVFAVATAADIQNLSPLTPVEPSCSSCGLLCSCTPVSTRNASGGASGWNSCVCGCVESPVGEPTVPAARTTGSDKAGSVVNALVQPDVYGTSVLRVGKVRLVASWQRLFLSNLSLRI